jgi:hypothetical protein
VLRFLVLRILSLAATLAARAETMASLRNMVSSFDSNLG